jgi:hypothetical protein
MFTEEQRLDNYLLQRWVGRRVAENPGRFKEILYEMWSHGPDEDWLKENFGITRQQFEAMDEAGKLPAEAGGEPTLSKRDILAEWEDERAANELRHAEASAEAAAERSTGRRWSSGSRPASPATRRRPPSGVT